MRVCCIIKVPKVAKPKMEKVASPFWRILQRGMVSSLKQSMTVRM